MKFNQLQPGQIIKNNNTYYIVSTFGTTWLHKHEYIILYEICYYYKSAECYLLRTKITEELFNKGNPKVIGNVTTN